MLVHVKGDANTRKKNHVHFIRVRNKCFEACIVTRKSSNTTASSRRVIVNNVKRVPLLARTFFLRTVSDRGMSDKEGKNICACVRGKDNALYPTRASELISCEQRKGQGKPRAQHACRLVARGMVGLRGRGRCAR